MHVCLVVLSTILVAATGQEGWNLVWEDEFDTFNHNNWQHEITAWGGGNAEFEMYTNDPDNSYVRDGILYIKPTLTVDKYGENVFFNGTANMFDYGFCSSNIDSGCYREKQDIPPIMSARLRTYQRFSFKYGKVVIEAKIPAGDWLWPAIWFLPEDWVYGGWPISGEIDLMESIGNRDFKTPEGSYLGIQHIGSTLHWGPAPTVNKWELTTASQYNIERNYADYFHTYELEWDENRIITRVDGEDVLKVPPDDIMSSWESFWQWGMENGGMGNLSNPWVDGTSMAPFDQAFHLILNVAVGGTNGFIPDNMINAGGARPKPWGNFVGQKDAQTAFWADKDNWYPTWEGENAAMQVKSVKVYQKGDAPPEENGSGQTSHGSALGFTIVLLITALIDCVNYYH